MDTLIYLFAACFIVVVIYLMLLWRFTNDLKQTDLQLWKELGEPSIFNGSADTNIKMLKYLFSNRPKSSLADSIKVVFIIFSILFICYVVLFITS